MEDNKKKKILFICLGNVCRSAVAEKIVNHLYSDKAEATSAGVHREIPNIEVDRTTIELMKKKDIDISKHLSKSYMDIVHPVDIVINMSYVQEDILKEAQPNLKNAQWIHWKIADPRHKSIEEYTSSYEDIEKKIQELLG